MKRDIFRSCLDDIFGDNSGICFLFLHKNLHCWNSLEATHGGPSNGYPQHRFLWQTGENYPRIIIKYSSILICFFPFFHTLRYGNYPKISFTNFSNKFEYTNSADPGQSLIKVYMVISAGSGQSPNSVCFPFLQVFCEKSKILVERFGIKCLKFLDIYTMFLHVIRISSPRLF